jgi:hypothetical protein
MSKGLHRREGKEPQQESSSESPLVDDDDDIEIIKIDESASLNITKTKPHINPKAKSRKPAGMTLVERNRLLRQKAEAQNRARREEEAREAAEKLAEKKRRRDLKRGGVGAAETGEGAEEDGEGDAEDETMESREFKKIQRLKVCCILLLFSSRL